MEVRIHSRKLVKPSNPTPHHLRTMKLTCFDQIAPKSYASFVYFYPSHRRTISGEDERFKQLERSLSELLTLFYPLAGRFHEDDNSIDCNDQGAELVEAEVNSHFHVVLRDAGADGNLITQLVPFDELAWTSVMLGVQVNKFNCGGLAVGVSLSHKFADGFTIFSFTNGWANSCNFGLNSVKRLSFDAASVLPPRVLNPLYGVPLPDDNSNKLITKRFVFSGPAITNLKSKTKNSPSRARGVMALIWKARICVAQAKQGKFRDSVLIFPLNIRGKTAIHIPENAAGNFFKNLTVRFTAKGKKPELDELVGLVQDAMKTATENFAKTEAVDELFSSATDCSKEIHEEIVRGTANICVCSSCCGFPYYEADFGWGRPKWIASAHKPTDFVLMMDDSCGRGIEAWVTLEPDDMFRFRQDPDIIAFSSVARSEL
ncbi:hypothetical protein SLE2022_155070 [Rubroshorea leprosula]